MVSGFNYWVSVLNLRNPEVNDPNIYKWIIEVSDTFLSKILYRSMQSTTNYL